MIVIALIGIVLLLGATWYFFGKAVSMFTASAPVDIRIEAPSDAEFSTANAKFDQMRNATAKNQAATFEFTAADLNALIARHPAFKNVRNKVRVSIENSIMSLDMSLPLSEVSVPGMSHRWFNGTAKLGLSYDDDNFSLSLRSLTANGRDIPLSILPAINTTAARGFNERMRRSEHADSAEEELWQHVRSLAIIDDKLVITTKGGEIAFAAQVRTPL